MNFTSNIPARFLTEAIGELYSGYTVYLHMDDNDDESYTIEAIDFEGVILETVLIKAKILENDWLATKYQLDRANEYPTIQEQLDMLYWDKINGTDTWSAAIHTVKAKFPKPE